MKLIRNIILILGLFFLSSEAIATQVSPDGCGALAYIVQSFSQDYLNKVPKNEWTREIDEILKSAPSDVKRLVELLEEVVIQAGPDVAPEDHGQGFLGFCYEHQGQVEDMNKDLEAWLLSFNNLKKAQ